MISFLSRLFKSTPNAAPATPEVSSLNNPKSTNTGATTGTATSPNSASYGPALLASALQGTTKQQKNVARERIAQLLTDNTLSLEQLTADSQDTEQLLILCSYNKPALEQIVAKIDDPMHLAQLANSASSALARKLAAGKSPNAQPLKPCSKAPKAVTRTCTKLLRQVLQCLNSKTRR